MQLHSAASLFRFTRWQLEFTEDLSLCLSVCVTVCLTVCLSVCCAAVPRVRSMSRSQTVVAGSELRLQCRVWGWPVPRVTWHRLGSQGPNSRIPLNFAADDRLSLEQGVAMAPPGVVIDNATLVIRSVTYDDRDVYVCDVSSYVSGSWRTDNGTVLVRVKGQLASLTY